MNKTEKIALRESVIVVLMGALINFPLMPSLNEEAKKSARFAQCSGEAPPEFFCSKDFEYKFSPTISEPADIISSIIPVLTAPGAMQFASMFVSSSSTAIVSINLTIPALEAAYELKKGEGWVAPPPDICIIFP